jgi:transforming growth factor-beta-induced protein
MSIFDWKFLNTNTGNFIWEAVNKAGEVLGRSSQEFKSQNGCKYNADLMGRSGSFSQKLIWDFMENNSGWSWKCDNTVNKENVGASHKYFATKGDAAQNAALFGYSGEFLDSSKPATSNNNETDGDYFGKGVAGAAVATGVGAVGSMANSVKSNTTINAKPIGNMSMDMSKKTVDESINRAGFVANGSDSEGGLGFLKWLLPLLILLGLLLWLVPMFLKGNDMNKPQIGITTSSLKLDLPKFDFKTALSNPKFSALSGLIGTAGIGNVLSGLGGGTLLAPTNDAFGKLPELTIGQLGFPSNLAALQNILKGHVLPAGVDVSKLADGTTVKNLAGIELPVTNIDGKITIDGIEVDPSLATKNGNLSIIEIPTVIIPNDLMLSDSPDVVATTSSVESSSTMSETSVSSTTMSSTAEVGYKAGGALEALKANGQFTTLLTAIDAAELTTVLDGDGPFTIFAPTDEALKTVPNLGDLLKPENKTTLQNFLKQHVVSGKNSFVDFQTGKTLTTLAGNSVKINTDNSEKEGQIVGSKNTAHAPVADINTNNAVIHTLPHSPIL